MVFQGGSAIPVYNIDASQLVENGGDFRVIGYLAYAVVPSSGTDFTNVNQIQFNTSYVPASQVAGTIYWNEAEKTLNIVVDDNVVLQAGQEILLPVRNQSGADIGDGAPVMYAGTTGNSGRTLIQPAIADGSIDPSFILGLATEPIPNNSDGFVTWFGKVREINTTGVPYGEVWIDGDILYVSATTAGYLTKTPPDAPNYRIQIAAVMNSAVNGVLTVRSTWNSKLVDLADVNGTPLTTDGQFPVWDDGNQYFDFTANIADFDAAGSAAAAQASAIADAATKYYNQSVFSATPTAAEPLKADGSGGLSVKAFSNRGLVSLGNDVLAGLLTIQNGYVLRPITANGLSVAARVSTTQALDVYGSGTHTGYLQTWRENSTANPLLATDTAGFNWLNVTTGQKEISLSRSSAHRLSVIAVKTTTDDGQNIDLRFAGESSTTANQNMARLAIDWYVNTHASRQADVIAYASDYGGEREIWRGRATGSSPAIGFYGVTPTERQLLATGAGASVDDVITALQTLGLVKQS